MEPIVIEKIVELKVNQLGSLQSVGMAWWAGSCVLCASIIAGVWRFGRVLSTNPLLPALRRAIGFFFLSIVAFGAFMTAHLLILANSLTVLNAPIASAVWWEFIATSISFAIATSSFVLVTIAWFSLVRSLRQASLPASHSAS
jgi:hypothetical protein